MNKKIEKIISIITIVIMLALVIFYLEKTGFEQNSAEFDFSKNIIN